MWINTFDILSINQKSPKDIIEGILSGRTGLFYGVFGLFAAKFDKNSQIDLISKRLFFPKKGKKNVCSYTLRISIISPI
jgi:hypothetical protein